MRRKLICVLAALLLTASISLPALGVDDSMLEGPTEEVEILPSEEETPPAEEEVPPPAEEEVPPAEKETPPMEEVPPAEGETPPPMEEEVPPAEEETPPAGEEVPPIEEEAPPVEEETPLVEEEAPSADSETICVILPSTTWVVVNPYGLEVERDGVASRERIVSPELVLINQGDPVRVSARAVGSVPGGSEAVFVSAPPDSDQREKAVFLFLEFQSEPGAWSGAFTDASNQLLVTEDGEEKGDLLTLAAESEGYFKLSGETSVSPERPWTAEDRIDVSVAFTFQPDTGGPDA